MFQTHPTTVAATPAWDVEATSPQAALALLSPYAAQRTTATEISEVTIPSHRMPRAQPRLGHVDGPAVSSPGGRARYDMRQSHG